MIKQTLESYRDLELDLKRLIRAYNKLHEKIGIGSISYDGMPKGTSNVGKVERDAEKLADAFKECKDKVQEVKLKLAEIENIIESVSDGRGRYVLHEYYISHRSFEDIGYDDEVDRCGRQVRRYHDEAIAELESKYVE